MLCLGIACIYVIPVRLSRAITRSSVICTLFFIIYGFRSQQNDRYGKSPITRRPDDGRLSGRNNRSVRAMAWFRPVRDSALKEAATCVLTEDTSLTLLSNRMENTGDSLNYLIEATEKTAGIINGMIRMRLVDEIILYMVPVIAGNGSRLFQSSLPESEWTCTESKRWKDNIIRITYGRKTPRQPVVVFKK